MRIKDFEFNLRELAGSTGDFGTLFPLAIGYFAVNGLNPAGLLVTGVAVNAVFGLPRMGAIFGGMLLSGRKVAQLAADLVGDRK